MRTCSPRSGPVQPRSKGSLTSFEKAGHVEMCVNNCAAEEGPPVNFVYWTMKYYLGQGENSCFKMAVEFLSCEQTALLSATSNDNITLQAKLIIWLEGLISSPSCQQYTENLARFACTTIKLFVNLHTPNEQFMKMKR